jgi:hypothetical protein
MKNKVMRRAAVPAAFGRIDMLLEARRGIHATNTEMYYLPSSLVRGLPSRGLCLLEFICVFRYVSSFSVSRLRAGLGVVPLLPRLLDGELGLDVAIS